ncbi:hypothetical protein V8D89_004717 [Ganoderma adspersum]
MSDNTPREKSSGKPSDLPPSRPHKNLQSVSPPLSHTPFRRFVYYIATFAIIVMAFYGWRMFQWKTEYGGWWNLALGRRPPGATATPTAGVTSARYTGKAAEGSTKLEDNLQALADALGMPSSDLASAIADAVREHVPPASLSSVAAHEPSGTAVQRLVNPDASAGSQAAGTVRSAFEAAIGLNEPPNVELDGE